MAKKKGLMGKLSKIGRGLGRELGNGPIARAARGKHTRGFI